MKILIILGSQTVYLDREKSESCWKIQKQHCRIWRKSPCCSAHWRTSASSQVWHHTTYINTSSNSLSITVPIEKCVCVCVCVCVCGMYMSVCTYLTIFWGQICTQKSDKFSKTSRCNDVLICKTGLKITKQSCFFIVKMQIVSCEG